MAANVIFCADGCLRDSWREAFADVAAARLSEPVAGDLVWVLVPPGQAAAKLMAAVKRRAGARPVVVLADEPGEEDALGALALGAAGYCNSHAAPEVLRQVETVVANGGIWVGQALMQRLLAGTARLVAPPTAGGGWAASLTEREREVALAVAAGASNKEIARQLAITERTVKAHVGAVLEKLGARDRLQLSLIVNGIAGDR